MIFHFFWFSFVLVWRLIVEFYFKILILEVQIYGTLIVAAIFAMGVRPGPRLFWVRQNSLCKDGKGWYSFNSKEQTWDKEITERRVLGLVADRVRCQGLVAAVMSTRAPEGPLSKFNTWRENISNFWRVLFRKFFQVLRLFFILFFLVFA